MDGSRPLFFSPRLFLAGVCFFFPTRREWIADCGLSGCTFGVSGGVVREREEERSKERGRTGLTKQLKKHGFGRGDVCACLAHALRSIREKKGCSE